MKTAFCVEWKSGADRHTKDWMISSYLSYLHTLWFELKSLRRWRYFKLLQGTFACWLWRPLWSTVVVSPSPASLYRTFLSTAGSQRVALRPGSGSPGLNSRQKVQHYILDLQSGEALLLEEGEEQLLPGAEPSSSSLQSSDWRSDTAVDLCCLAATSQHAVANWY